MDTNVICASGDVWRRRWLFGLLEDAGFNVRMCATAEELLHLAGRWRRTADQDAAVLILDAQLSQDYLPSRVVKALRYNGIPIRTIILAASDYEGEIIRCLSEGADDFVHYPTEPAEIVERVCRVHSLPNLV